MGAIVAHRDYKERYWYRMNKSRGFVIKFGIHGDQRDREIATVADQGDADDLCRLANRREFANQDEIKAAKQCFLAAGGEPQQIDGPTGAAANERDPCRWLWQHAARLWEDRALRAETPGRTQADIDEQIAEERKGWP